MTKITTVFLILLSVPIRAETAALLSFDVVSVKRSTASPGDGSWS